MKTSKCILVIDADHETRVLIRRQLEDAGHFIVSATSSREALILLDRITLPAVILASKDAFGNGEPFLPQLRKYKNYATVPVAQIGTPDIPLIRGACGLANPVDLDDVTEWLNSGKLPPNWKIP